MVFAARAQAYAQNPANAGAFGEVAEAHEMLGDVKQAKRSATAAMEWCRAREMYIHFGR